MPDTELPVLYAWFLTVYKPYERIAISILMLQIKTFETG